MIKEKKLKNSAEPVSISSTKTILNQMMYCICKIKINETYGTGFFCKVPFENNQSKNFLITNYHILDKKYYEKNTKINLLLNDENIIKIIDLRMKRNTYFNKDNDITLIELNKSDDINTFLEIDDKLFIDNNEIIYENKSLYVLQYPQGKNAAVSFGLLNSIDNSEIIHTCSTENGSSGSPILNLETNKVIGIHKEGSINFEFNKGTYLKYPLIDFLQKTKTKIIEKKNNSILDNSKINNIQNKKNNNFYQIDNNKDINSKNLINKDKNESDILDDNIKPQKINNKKSKENKLSNQVQDNNINTDINILKLFFTLDDEEYCIYIDKNSTIEQVVKELNKKYEINKDSMLVLEDNNDLITLNYDKKIMEYQKIKNQSKLIILEI